MPRVKAIIEYEGTRYFGWQLQKGQNTIQAEIEKALRVIFKQSIRVTGSGRTDTGVHAKGQTAHFDVPDFPLRKLKRSLNGLLPEDIVIKDIEYCADDFHARYHAVERRYCYYISLEPTAIHRRFVWTIPATLNLTLMQKGAELIKRVVDFKAFCKIKSKVKHHRCKIFKSEWFEKDGLLVYQISADRFLHGMVRSIVGSFVALGNGKITLTELESIIDSKDRTRVPLTAPPQGLILEEVKY